MDIEKPIFLVGFPRSGTTYLQSLLATQKGIVSFPETHFYTVLTGYLSTSDHIQKDAIAEILNRAERMMELEFETEVRTDLLNTIPVRGIERRILFEWFVGQLCLAQNRGPIQSSEILLEKTPSHAWHLEKIKSDYPDARIVYITRHPVDAIVSHYVNLSKGDRSIEHLIQDWELTYDHLTAYRERNEHSLYQLRYEDLKANRSNEMRVLMDFLKIPFNEPALNDFSARAEELVLSYETWKEGNTTDIPNSNNKRRLGWKKIASIQHELRNKMELQGYVVRKSLKQFAYDLIR